MNYLRSQPRLHLDFSVLVFTRHGTTYGGLVYTNTACDYSCEAVHDMVTQLYGDFPWLPFVKGGCHEDVLKQLDEIVKGILPGDENYFKWRSDQSAICHSFCSNHAANRRNMIEHYQYMKCHEESKPYYKESENV